MKRLTTLIIMSALALATLCLGACGAPSPSEVTARMLDAVKAQDYEGLQECYSENAPSLNAGDLVGNLSGVDADNESEATKTAAKQIAAVIADFDYELGAERVSGDSATVEVTIRSHDLGTALADAMGEYFASALNAAFTGASQEELSRIFADAFLSKMAEQTEKSHVATTSFHLTRENGEWKLDELSTDNLDCITGGMISSLQGLASAFGSSSGK